MKRWPTEPVAPRTPGEGVCQSRYRLDDGELEGDIPHFLGGNWDAMVVNWEDRRSIE